MGGSIMVREYTLYDFSLFQFVDICFMTSMCSILVNVPWELDKDVY